MTAHHSLTFNVCLKGATFHEPFLGTNTRTVYVPATMEKQVLLSIVLRIVFHLILFVLFVHFYLIEQMGDYIAGRATTTSRLEQVTQSEFPTITICMDPPLKPSVVSKYGFKSAGEVSMKDIPNTTLLEKLKVLSYILNQDFSIKIIDEDWKETNLIDGENEKFFIEPVITYLQGICFKMEPKFIVKNKWIDIWLQIEFKNIEIDLDQPSHFVLYLTSPNATLNIATAIWPQYLPGKVKVPFNTQKVTIIKYDRTIEYTFKIGVKNSSKCMAKVIQESECKNKCCHISGCSLPICNSSIDFDCVWGKYALGQQCLSQKHSLAYPPTLLESPIYQDTYYNFSSPFGIFMISSATDTNQIVEEIDVITLAGLIGSVGGSLGMFFGFSLTSYLLFAIEKFTKKIFKP